ncbi:MAG: 50S ribosomal protein L11 methyltransferase [Bacteroidota bacterium]
MNGEALREKVLEEMGGRFELDHFELEIGGRTYSLATVTNVDDLLDELIQKGPGDQAFKDEQIPYWADLWHASIGLTRWIEEGKVVVAGQKVLEIGCGLGLCGIAAAFQGAEVVLTDYLPDALLLARYNWLLNHSIEPDCRLLDWRQPKVEWKSDILLASDVAYEERALHPLVNTFKTMTTQNGSIWLSEPGRKFAKPWINQILDFGFNLTKYDTFVSYQGIDSQVGIYQLSPEP